jgi:hypothetical protein
LLCPKKHFSSGDFDNLAGEVAGLCIASSLIIALTIGRDRDLFSKTLL